MSKLPHNPNSHQKGSQLTYIHRPHNHEWYEGLNKAPITPPPFLISILWFSVYGCMAYSTYLFAKETNFTINLGLGIMVSQVLLIYVWYNLFFVRKNPRAAICITITMFFVCLWNIF